MRYRNSHPRQAVVVVGLPVWIGRRDLPGPARLRVAGQVDVVASPKKVAEIDVKMASMPNSAVVRVPPE